MSPLPFPHNLVGLCHPKFLQLKLVENKNGYNIMNKFAKIMRIFVVVDMTK